MVTGLSNWNEPDAYSKVLDGLVRDLNADPNATATE